LDRPLHSRSSYQTRNWTPVAAVALNPERDAVTQAIVPRAKQAHETEPPHKQRPLRTPGGNLLDTHRYFPDP
jgi:hypothetical protein